MSVKRTTRINIFGFLTFLIHPFIGATKWNTFSVMSHWQLASSLVWSAIGACIGIGIMGSKIPRSCCPSTRVDERIANQDVLVGWFDRRCVLDRRWYR